MDEFLVKVYLSLLQQNSFWEGVELWRKHSSTSPEFGMAAEVRQMCVYMYVFIKFLW